MVMSREWTQRDYQTLWFTGNLKEGNNEAVPGEPGKMEYNSHEWKRSKIGRMEQSKAMEYESRKASWDVLKLRNIYNVIDSQQCILYVNCKYILSQKIPFQYYQNLEVKICDKKIMSYIIPRTVLSKQTKKQALCAQHS